MFYPDNNPLEENFEPLGQLSSSDHHANQGHEDKDGKEEIKK